MGRCLLCGRLLKTAKSNAAGIGPTCAKKYDYHPNKQQTELFDDNKNTIVAPPPRKPVH